LAGCYDQTMSLLQVVLLAIVQGLAELLPVSSSAHVVVAEKLMGLDPSSPPMTLLLVLLHTGTMLAVIAYFWRQWRDAYFRSMAAFRGAAVNVLVATAVTGVVGETVIKIIEKTVLRDAPGAQIEDLFSHLEIIAPALAVVGVLILIAGLTPLRKRSALTAVPASLNIPRAGLIGAVQGLSLPFRGFSRSGATISTGILAGVSKQAAETFSFALAVVLTPVVVARETMRLVQMQSTGGIGIIFSVFGLTILGAALAFLAGLLALKWLSRWLESGRWYLFGIYCLFAAAGVFALYRSGY